MSFRSLPYGRKSWFVYAALLFLGFAAPGHAKDVHILAFGDSLTAGYGLEQGQGFAPQLQGALRRNGIAAYVVNGGVSGDTTAAGRATLTFRPSKAGTYQLRLYAGNTKRVLGGPSATRKHRVR